MNDTKPKQTPAGILSLVKPNLFQWLGRALLNWVEIGAILFIAGLINHLGFYIVAIMLLATRQHALAIMGHDAAHYTASRNRPLNNRLACLLVFWPLGMGMDGYRKFHFAHHKWTGTDLDPELIHKKWAGREWATPMTRSRLAGYLMKDIMGFAVRDIIRVIRIIKPASLQDRLAPLGWWAVALIIMYATNTLWIAVVWWISINTAYWAIFRMRMMTEHVGTAATHRVSASWWQKWIFMPHNTWCHYEHHRWPSIPCWNLPKARALDTASIISVSDLWRSYKDYPAMPYGFPLTAKVEAKTPVPMNGAVGNAS